MEDFFTEYQNILAYGIFINFLATIGFGMYKSVNISGEEAWYLLKNYTVPLGTGKLVLFWFVPFLGYFFVLKEVFKLQLYIRRGKSVFEFVEDKMKKAEQENREY